MTEHSEDEGSEGLPALAKEIIGSLEPERLWGPIAGLALGLALLGLAVWNVDLQAVGRAMQDADPFWIGVALVSVLLTLATKAGRWRGLFGKPFSPRYWSVSRALVVGKLVSTVVPARLGEVARFFMLSRDEELSQATVMGTIAAEKVFDLLFLVLTAGLTAAVTPTPAWLTGFLVSVAGLGGALFVALMALPHPWITATAQRVGAWLPKALETRFTGLVDRVLAGLASLRQPDLALRACAWSVVIWGFMATTNLALFRAFELPLSVGAALLVLTLINAGTMVPTSPGELGVFHALTLIGLQSLSGARSAGIDRASGLAYATVLHIVVYGPRVVLGALALGLRPEPRSYES